MKELTKEQRERLAPYERHLHTAYYADYVVGLASKITDGTLWPVYKEVYPGDNPGNPTCDFCVIRVCKRLGALYFADNEKGTAEPAKNENQERKPRKQRTNGGKTKKQ